ncbi:MAG: hypothetical protein ABIP93_01895 [Gemmatimonadaceae bacterium]
MTGRPASLAALLLAHDATEDDTDTLDDMTRTALEVGAAPIVVALPAGVEPPPRARVVRSRPGGPLITALRLGMAQLTNSPASAVLLLPLRGIHPRRDSLRALVDGAKGAGDAIVAFEDASLDDAPVLIPRDAWLELVTMGEGGLGALAERRRVLRVDAPLD